MLKKKISFFIILLFLLLFIAAKMEKPAYKEIFLQTYNGDKIYLNKISDRLIIVDFWATWCPPCRMTIPKLIEIKNKFKDKVAILGASLDRKISEKELKNFCKAKKINYPVGFANKYIYYYFGPIRAIPTIFIVSPKGEVLDKVVGYDPELDVKVKYYLKKFHIKGKKENRNGKK